MLKAVSSRTIVPPWKIFYTLLPPWKIFDTKVRLAHRKTPSDVPSTSGAIFDSSAVPFRYVCQFFFRPAKGRPKKNLRFQFLSALL